MPFTLRTVDQYKHYCSMLKTATVGTTTAQPQAGNQVESTGSSPDDGLQLTQVALLACIRQLGSLHDQSMLMVRCLYDELEEVDRRVDKLTNRMQTVRKHANELPLPDAEAVRPYGELEMNLWIANAPFYYFALRTSESAGSLKHFLSVKRHYCSAKPEEFGDALGTNQTNLFLCESRPDSLRLLYARSSSREDYPFGLQKPKTTDSFAVQTEPDEVFTDDSSFSVDFRRPRPRRRSSFSADTPLPTPEEKVQKFVAACKPTTLEVDLPAAMLKRMSRKWATSNANAQSQWKSATTADSEGTFGQPSYRTSISPSCAAGSVSPLQEDVIDSLTDDEEMAATERDHHESVDLFQCAAAKEYLYDFAPFYRRQRIGGIKQFLSLRRPKRSPTTQRAHKSEYTSFNDADDTCDRWSKEKKEPPEGNHTKTSFDIANSIKCFLKKSFSFRSSSSVVRQPSQKVPTADRFRLESLDEKTAVGEKRSVRNHYVNAKSSLPISTSSQVMNLATLLRRHASFKRPASRHVTTQVKSSSPRNSGDSAYLSGGEKRARPASIVSGDSQISLGLGERVHSNTYHPGYQINYPEECTNSISKASTPLIASALPNHVLVKQLNRVRHATPSPSCSPSMRSNSSAVESNYSCDQEGYFTSMHHDCGVPMVRVSNRNQENGPRDIRPKEDAGYGRSLAFQSCKPLSHSSTPYATWLQSRNPQKCQKMATVGRKPSQRHGNTGTINRPVVFPRTAGLQVILNRQGLSAAPVCHSGYKSCGHNVTNNEPTKVPIVPTSTVAPSMQIGFKPQPAPKLLSAGTYGPKFAVVNPHAWSGNVVLAPGVASPAPMDDHVYPLANAKPIENGATSFENQSCLCRPAACSLPPRNRRMVVALAPSAAQSINHYENHPGSIERPARQPVKSPREEKVTEMSDSVDTANLLSKSEVAAPAGGLEPFDQWLMAKFHVEEQETRLKEAKALEQAKLDALMDLQKLTLASPDLGRRCKMEAALTNALPYAGIRFLD
ncbi:Serine [Trichuris trichiura]|uniref:Serine n=1 Tax=Trichuris trichiura TaxID=36087 RepID=A0A077YXZ1_TRITR|nr:Serine [Trichuris trichiura]